VRPVLACRMTIAADGTIEDDIEFFAATIESKAKLAYDDVSDWLENTGSWQPEATPSRADPSAASHLLNRGEWRQTHALVFKDRPDYRLFSAKKAKCWISSPNRVALRTASLKKR
jgi:exoribonuclease-2